MTPYFNRYRKLDTVTATNPAGINLGPDFNIVDYRIPTGNDLFISPDYDGYGEADPVGVYTRDSVTRLRPAFIVEPIALTAPFLGVDVHYRIVDHRDPRQGELFLSDFFGNIMLADEIGLGRRAIVEILNPVQYTALNNLPTWAE